MSSKFKAPDVRQPKAIFIHGVEYIEKQQLLAYIRTGAKVILANLAGKPESQEFSAKQWPQPLMALAIISNN